MKDQHIQARMDQFKANRGGDVDITKCDVIKEYIDSGRADQVHQTTEGSCTNSEASNRLPFIHSMPFGVASEDNQALK